jgi:hypothetical protein
MSYLKPQNGLFVLLFILMFTIFAAPEEARAQGSLQQSPLELPRNPELEREAKHNLEVARFYMKKKAYKAVTDRLLEVSYVYPQFSKFDEVLFLLGDAFLKQNNKAEAARHLKQLVDDFPESQFAKEAKKLLPDLPAVADSKKE